MRRLNRLLSISVVGIMLLSACSPAALASSLRSMRNRIAAQTTSQQVAQPQVQATPSVQPNTNTTAGSVNSPEALAAFQGTLEEIYQKVNPSVVNIQVTVQSPSQNGLNPFGFSSPDGSQLPTQTGVGSGFVWDTAGHIVTNNHVVDGATEVTVTFSDGYSVPGKVIGQDVNSDLAVIQVNVPDSSRLQPVQIADSSQVKVGQMAIAIGNPFALEGTMTLGIISALGRSLPVQNGQTAAGAYQIPDVIQTDAPINPGNSGGVLLNDLGQLVGVTAAIESSTNSSAGIGFAIPSQIVEKVVPALIKDGKFAYPWLGIQGTTLTSEFAAQLNLKQDQRGAYVVAVTENGPAAKAGIKGASSQVQRNGATIPTGGDVITAVDGKQVNSFDEIVSYLINNTQVGQKVTFTILRDGIEQTVDVTLEARPASQGATAQTTNLPGQTAWLGIQGADITPELAQALQMNQGMTGILVERVQANSPADQAGLRGGSNVAQVNGQQVLTGGDIIVAIDNQPLTGMSDLQTTLSNARPGDQVTLTVVRDGSQMDLSVTLGARPTQ